MAEQSVERNEQPMIYDQYLGHTDLARHPKFKDALISGNRRDFEAILVQLGADLKYGYEEEVCLHRPRTSNIPVHGVLVRFRERRDDYWVKNMMQTSDIVRMTSEETGSLRATGMRESLGEDNPMFTAMAQSVSAQLVSADIVVNDGEEKQNEEVE